MHACADAGAGAGGSRSCSVSQQMGCEVQGAGCSRVACEFHARGVLNPAVAVFREAIW